MIAAFAGRTPPQHFIRSVVSDHCLCTLEMDPETMSTASPPKRIAYPMPQPDGTLCCRWNLTDKSLTDLVVLRVGVVNALPIVFVPGIMGSNLRSKDGQNSVWGLDTVAGLAEVELAAQKAFERAGERQKTLHPDRTVVDTRGSVPSRPCGSVQKIEQYKERGWGEIGERSYHGFLLKIEEIFNGFRSGQALTAVEAQVAALMAKRSGRDSAWRPQKEFMPSDPSEIAALRNWYMPVYACGYNWLDDNANAALRLKGRIKEVIAKNNGPWSRCEQVILITHSMGGLVARACQQLDGMQEKIAGIVHGVMPANGAPVAYRRCKVGMIEEDPVAARVIGTTGPEVTAVFAQAPGALQLLPTQRYGPWLELRDAEGETVRKALPESNPYGEIYSLRDPWWALVKEEWLSPEGGEPIKWAQYLRFLDRARDFHEQVTERTYHPNTYAFYGADSKAKTKSFERIVWRMKRFPRRATGVSGRVSEQALPGGDEVYDMTPEQVEMDGVNPEVVRANSIVATASTAAAPTPTPQWLLYAELQDGTGDGTVPASSGRAPAECEGVRQVFRLSGVEHEGAFRESAAAQQVTVYAIIKIALEARVPEGTPSVLKASTR